MLRDFSLRDFGASLNTVEGYTNESSQGKIGLYETVSKQKCTHLGMFLASVVYSSTATNENPISSLRVSNIGIKAADIEETAMGYSDKRCSDYANYLLKKKMRIAIAGTITCTPLPHLDCNRVIKVYQNEEDVNEIDLLIEEVQIPLSPEAYSLSICNIQDLPLTCYTSMIPQSAWYTWVFVSGTNTVGKFVNSNDDTYAIVPAKINSRTVEAIGGGSTLEDGSSGDKSVLGLDIIEKLEIEDGVSAINNYAFFKKNKLTSINIPNSVMSIGDYAFYNCTSLASITIPGSATSIGEYAFTSCSNLKNIIIGDGVTNIGDRAFSSCSSLKNITIPDSVTSIGSWTFVYCTSLTSIKISDNVTKIENGVFQNCTNLESVIIGKNVKSIGGDSVWYNCNLERVYISDIVAWCNIDFKHQSDNPLYYAKKLYINNNLVSNISIPIGVAKIKFSVFYNCQNLKSIIMPDSVAEIGSYSFCGCSNLKNVIMSQNLTNIENYAFRNCSNLESITIPDSVTSIGDGAFEYCKSLANITISDGITNIGASAFNNTAYIDNQTTDIKYVNNWVVDCNNSVETVYIKEGTRGIADSAFESCAWIRSINNLNGVKFIGKKAFYGIKYTTSIVIPDSVISVGESAFGYCTKLKSITFKNPECEIYDSENTISDTVSGTRFSGTIYGYENSTAQAYAEKYGRTFVAITE